MDALRLDLRYAFANLRRRPAFSALAVLTLALGIGVNTIAFSAVNALLFHPLDFPTTDRLGWIMLATPGNPRGQLSWEECREVQRSRRAFDAISAQGRQPLAWDVDGHTEQIWSLLVSTDYFRMLGARAEIGRVLSDADANSSDLAAVVSHRFWLDRLGGGPIAGRVLRISNRTVSIVGVLPDDFRGPGGLYAPDVWLPVEQMRALNLPPRLLNGRWLGAFARIADGASIPQAHGELAALSAHVAGVERLQRETAGTFDFRFYPMSEGHPELRAIGRFVWMAMTIVGLVLLIACF